MKCVDKVRGSSATIAINCAGSLVDTDAGYDPQEDGIEGTAKHVALAHVTRGEDVPMVQIAERYHVDADDIEIAVRQGRKALEQVGQWLPLRAAEMKVEGVYTRGTMDILSVLHRATIDPENLEVKLDRCPPDIISLADWKTGYSADAHPCQLLAYADAARHEYGMPSSGYITAFEIWLRSGMIETHNFTVDMLDGFRERVRKQLESAASDHPQYAAGPHCKFCSHQQHCKPHTEYIRATVESVAVVTDDEAVMPREVLGELYERSKFLTRAMSRYTAMLDIELRAGPITLADGRILELVEEERDDLQAVAVDHVLREQCGFDDAEMAEVLSATKSGIERVVKSRVAKGQGASEMRRIMGSLREADAIEKKFTYKKGIRKP